jgi:hypothetical protein
LQNSYAEGEVIEINCCSIFSKAIKSNQMRTPERVIWDPRSPQEQTAGVQAALRRLDAQRAQQSATEPAATDLQAKTREAAQKHALSRGQRYIPHITDKK